MDTSITEKGNLQIKSDPTTIKFDYTLKYMPRDMRERFNRCPFVPFTYTPEQKKIISRIEYEKKTIRNKYFNLSLLSGIILLAGAYHPRFSKGKLIIGVEYYNVS